MNDLTVLITNDSAATGKSSLTLTGTAGDEMNNMTEEEKQVQVSFAPGCLGCDRRGNIMYGGELPDEVYERIAEIMSPYIRDKLSEERNRDDRI